LDACAPVKENAREKNENKERVFDHLRFHRFPPKFVLRGSAAAGGTAHQISGPSAGTRTMVEARGASEKYFGTGNQPYFKESCADFEARC
jgi:hypothetical protein